MGNPRQRHKARSSAHKVIRHSRHAKRNLRKMKPIRGPKALQDAWDKKKTLRQNYAALGLASSLKKAESGGSEHPAASTSSEESAISLQKSKEKDSGALPRGFGKIIRDAEGNVISVEVPDDVADDGSADVEEAPKTELVNELERLAQTARPVPRFSSNGEIAALRKLIAKHGQDFEAMAKDRRINEWQRTAGQLQRAFRRAGLL